MRRNATVVLLALLAMLPSETADRAEATGRWAPVASAAIRPGAQTFTAGAQCTANFVFADAEHVYLGQAAHCASLDEPNETNGCLAQVRPLGTQVRITGARDPGTIVYSSWVAMQRRGERDPEWCDANDFALVRLSRFDARRVNPSVPYWGGPTGLATTVRTGDRVVAYGRSGLWLGVPEVHPRRGIALTATPKHRGFRVATAPPGIPGDSGSGYLDAHGRALGVLSTLEAAPLTGTNHLSGLAAALSYLRRVSALRVRLVPGTVPFRGSLD